MTGLLPQFRTLAGAPDHSAPIGSLDELVGFFEAGCKTESEMVLGAEYERLPLLEDGTAATYEDSGSRATVRGLLEHLLRAGLDRVEADGRLLGLAGEGFEVQLEPGAQVELALKPYRTAHEVLARLEDWREMLREAAAATGVHAVALGLQPLTPVPDLRFIPKARYGIMKSHLGARGDLAHHMMKATAGFQLNVDYQSEADAGELMRASLGLSPLVNAFCLNSPLEAGARNGWQSKRPEIWRRTDPERCGLLPWVFDEGFSFARYVEWALSAPVMFLVRGGTWHVVGDRTFGALVRDGHPTLGPACHGDFHLHLTTLFPEVRLKQHAEIRGTDSASVELVAGVTALWRGVLYDVETRRKAFDLVRDLTTPEREALHLDVARRGLGAPLRGVPVAQACATLLDLAASALDEMAGDDRAASDAPLLAPLRDVLARGRTPAELLLEAWDRGDRTALVDMA